MALGHLDLADGVMTIPRTKNGKPRTSASTPRRSSCLRAYMKRRNGMRSPLLWIGRQRRR